MNGKSTVYVLFSFHQHTKLYFFHSDFLIGMEKQHMRKRNWSAYSAAGHIDTLHPFKEMCLERDAKKIYDTPKVGSIIIVNEVIQEPCYIRMHGQRGCYYVMELTAGGLYLCSGLYNEKIRHNTCFKRVEFLKGIYRFVEVEKPFYGENMSWEEYDLENFA